MNTTHLEELLREDRRTRGLLGGVYPCDLLPRRRRPSQRLFVANTDPHHLPGTHWVAIYFTPEGHCIYFNSYGLPPFNHHLLRFVQRSGPGWTYNTRNLQDMSSNVCGHYCVAFAHHMARGKTLLQFLRLFHNNTRVNDCNILNFVKRHYRSRAAKILQQKHQQKCRRQIHSRPL